MGRRRADVVYTPEASERVSVRARRDASGRTGGYRIHWRDAAGRHHESSRPTLADAKDRADQLAAVCRLPDGAKTLLELLEDYLVTRRPDHWVESYATLLTHLAKWFEPSYGVACGELGARHVERAVEELRQLGRAPSTEHQVVGLWNRACAFGRQWGYLGEHQVTACRITLRKDTKIRATGEEAKVWHRSDLPTWDELLEFARLAAEVSGVWWEELRVLWLCVVGERWGEHVAQRGQDLWLAPGSGLKEGQVRVSGKVTELGHRNFTLDDYTKNGTTRVTAYPRRLHELVERRYRELSAPADLLFPDRRGSFQSRSGYRSRLFLPIGEKVGWPVVSRRPNGRPTALLYHPHDFRHVCATSMLTTPSSDPERWFEGRGMSAYEVALALGDTVETILLTYVGRSEAGPTHAP